ncbi:MAG TPA: hypothetical protein VMR02_21010 [Terracidiphilus sp.]|nr:hypothetical protein [Terracidiphilus sp.]
MRKTLDKTINGRKTGNTGRDDSDRKHLTRREVERLIEATRGSRNEARDRSNTGGPGETPVPIHPPVMFQSHLPSASAPAASSRALLSQVSGRGLWCHSPLSRHFKAPDHAQFTDLIKPLHLIGIIQRPSTGAASFKSLYPKRPPRGQ